MHPRLRVQRILWAALMVSGGVFVLVAKAAAPAPNPRHPPDPTMLYAIGAVALVVAVLSFVLPARQRARAFRDLPPYDPSSPHAAAALKKRFLRANTIFVLTMALRQAVGLFGLVIAMNGFGLTVALGFFLASLALMAASFPTMSQITR